MLFLYTCMNIKCKCIYTFCKTVNTQCDGTALEVAATPQPAEITSMGYYDNGYYGYLGFSGLLYINNTFNYVPFLMILAFSCDNRHCRDMSWCSLCWNMEMLKKRLIDIT